MSSDASYACFLAQANANPAANTTASSTASKTPGAHLRAVDTGANVPVELKSLDSSFRSEVDSRFEVVCLEGGDMEGGDTEAGLNEGLWCCFDRAFDAMMLSLSSFPTRSTLSTSASLSWSNSSFHCVHLLSLLSTSPAFCSHSRRKSTLARERERKSKRRQTLPNSSHMSSTFNLWPS